MYKRGRSFFQPGNHLKEIVREEKVFEEMLVLRKMHKILRDLKSLS